MKYLGSIVLGGLLILTAACASKEKVNTSFRAKESGLVPVNGIHLYYEVYGEPSDVPLILLPGGGSTIQVTYERSLPYFAKHRRVIAVEEQGHGRSTPRSGPVTFEQSADDVAALMKYLKIEKADVFGFSNGANIAMHVALRHPEQVRKLVFASSFTKKSGAPAEFWSFIKNANFEMMPQPLKDAFLRVNPNANMLKAMHDKDAERMKKFKDLPDREVKKIKAETLILMGDRDVVKPEHGIELTRLIAGSRLLILPGGHGDYLGEIVMTQQESSYPEYVVGIVNEFLNGIKEPSFKAE